MTEKERLRTIAWDTNRTARSAALYFGFGVISIGLLRSPLCAHGLTTKDHSRNDAPGLAAGSSIPGIDVVQWGRRIAPRS